MATIQLTRPDGMWTGRIVGPRELSDGMGVDLNLGSFVTGWGSDTDGRNTGSDMRMHADPWDWMAMAGRQAGASGEKHTRPMAGEYRRV